MKVLLLNTYGGNGGAAIAAARLQKALKGAGIDVGMLTADDFSRRRFLWQKAWERFIIWARNGFSMKSLWAVSIANTGFDITGTKQFREADIIHLHWVNQGFLSMKSIKNILSSGKPVVWTMHDMWPLTGICHHARECEAYSSECNRCMFLKNNGASVVGARSLAAEVFWKKKELYRDKAIRFVACSQWLGGKVLRSVLAEGNEVSVIPNPLDTDAFAPIDTAAARTEYGLPEDKKLILFGAANVRDKRKGIDYFVSACRELCSKHPEVAEQCDVVCYGGNSDALQPLIPLKVHSLGFVRGEERLISLYNAVSVFVTPSLEENLPNTIMEAMSCGTPCVGFRVGGIPEMIDHKSNGYVAEYKNASDLAAGIHWVLQDADYNDISESARQKVLDRYSEQTVARQYIEQYETAIRMD